MSLLPYHGASFKYIPPVDYGDWELIQSFSSPLYSSVHSIDGDHPATVLPSGASSEGFEEVVIIEKKPGNTEWELNTYQVPNDAAYTIAKRTDIGENDVLVLAGNKQYLRINDGIFQGDVAGGGIQLPSFENLNCIGENDDFTILLTVGSFDDIIRIYKDNVSVGGTYEGPVLKSEITWPSSISGSRKFIYNKNGIIHVLVNTDSFFNDTDPVGIYSNDDGETWQMSTSIGMDESQLCTQIHVVGGNFVAVGASNLYMVSSDGDNWTHVIFDSFHFNLNPAPYWSGSDVTQSPDSLIAHRRSGDSGQGFYTTTDMQSWVYQGDYVTAPSEGSRVGLACSGDYTYVLTRNSSNVRQYSVFRSQKGLHEYSLYGFMEKPPWVSDSTSQNHSGGCYSTPNDGDVPFFFIGTNRFDLINSVTGEFAQPQDITGTTMSGGTYVPRLSNGVLYSNRVPIFSNLPGVMCSWKSGNSIGDLVARPDDSFINTPYFNINYHAGAVVNDSIYMEDQYQDTAHINFGVDKFSGHVYQNISIESPDGETSLRGGYVYCHINDGQYEYLAGGRSPKRFGSFGSGSSSDSAYITIRDNSLPSPEWTRTLFPNSTYGFYTIFDGVVHDGYIYWLTDNGIWRSAVGTTVLDQVLDENTDSFSVSTNITKNSQYMIAKFRTGQLRVALLSDLETWSTIDLPEANVAETVMNDGSDDSLCLLTRFSEGFNIFKYSPSP